MHYDVVVIGGGIVGLATSLQLKNKVPGIRLIVLEKERELASHQSGNNSGVIHSGLYYKPGSLKATNCIRGYSYLLEFCQKHDVPFDLCGKIVVAASPAEVPLLNNLLARGIQNGLQNLKRLNRDQLREYEPHVTGIEAIFVPQTGIVDYKQVALKYAALVAKAEGEIRLGERVTQIRREHRGASVITDNGAYSTRLVINCGGLYSDKIAGMSMRELNVRIIPFRGEYFKLKKESEHLVRNLVYPVPDPNFPFLGVHFTRMARGGVEAGPNAVLAWRREGYKKTDVHWGELRDTLAWPGFRRVAAKYWRTGLGELFRSFSKAAFTQALQKLIPEIKQEDLVEGGVGVRAQACDRSGGLVDDFLIMEDECAVHVCNAPSPAATSSLAIGETVANLALKRF